MGWWLTRLVPLVLFPSLAGSGLGCGETDAGQETMIDYDRLLGGTATDGDRMPVISCVDSVADTAFLREVAARRAQELDGRPALGSGSKLAWIPGRATRFAVTPTFIYVLDSQTAEVYRFSPKLEILGRWGGRGGGPGEFASTTDLAVHPGDGSVWVLDGANRRISVFDSTGTFLRNIDVPTRATRLALSGSDDVVIGRPVLHVDLDTASPVSVPQPYVFALDQSGRMRDTLLVATAEEIGTRPFVTRAFTEVELRGGEWGTAVLYPSGGVIDLLLGDGSRSRLQVCAPDAVLDHYHEEREEGVTAENARYTQADVPLIGDVRVDPRARDVLVIGSIPTSSDHYHVDRLAFTGESRGSVLLPRQLRLPFYLRFGPTEREVTGLLLDGTIAIVRWGSAAAR